MKQKNTRRGFTLIELLVVVLIIGILAAIAVPQYQKAVMKSRFSALMPIAKSIANGNEVYYMEHGTYATSPATLDVVGQATYPDGTELDMSTGDYSYVIAGRENNFPLNYIVYQKHSGKFADNIHCEANENNTVAQGICQSLGGQLINGSQTDGFLTYVLSGTVGEHDKFPTSIAKLKAQICAGLSEDECTSTDTTITTNQCTGDATTGTKECTVITYNDSGEQTNYERQTKQCFSYTCDIKTYDENGMEIDRRQINCRPISRYISYLEGEGCVPYKTGWSYREDRNANNKTIFEASCKIMDENNNCTKIATVSLEYWPGTSTISSRKYGYCDGALYDDGNCSSGYGRESDDPKRSGYRNMGQEITYNQQGKEIKITTCSVRNAAGVCTDYLYYRYNTYDETGRTKTSNIEVTQNSPGYIYVNYIDDVDSSNTYYTRRCYSFDWDNGVCNSWTAN